MNSLLPDVTTVIIFLLFSMARFENQRWVKARKSGLKGANILFGNFVDITSLVGTIASYIFLAILWYKTSWKQPLCLYVFEQIFGILTMFVLGKDSLIKWMLGTFGVWIIGIVLLSRIIFFYF